MIRILFAVLLAAPSATFAKGGGGGHAASAHVSSAHASEPVSHAATQSHETTSPSSGKPIASWWPTIFGHHCSDQERQKGACK